MVKTSERLVYIERKQVRKKHGKAKKKQREQIPIMEVVKRIETAPGWQVITKFEASAAFFIPYKDGIGWNSTAGVDGGGKAVIQVHRNFHEKDIVVVRWMNYTGKDGLNCRILHMLPIQRGEDHTEFFFKSASTTTSGISRKTIFALKFENLDDADEFEMWWFKLSGQLAEWKKTEKATNVDDIYAKSVYAKSVELLEEVVNVCNDIEFFSLHSSKRQKDKKAKRKFEAMKLKSPTTAASAAAFSFDEQDEFKSPAKKKIKKEERLEMAEESSARISNNNRKGDYANNNEVGNQCEDSSSSSDEDDDDDDVYRDSGEAAMSQDLRFLLNSKK